MLEVTADWDNLDEGFAEIEAQLTGVIRGMTVTIWRDVLKWTPQYHGRMAASWTYSIGAPTFVDRSAAVDFVGPRRTQIGKFAPVDALYKGHPVGIGVANAASAGREQGYKLGDTVWIANGVDHGEGPYSQAIESGEIPLRLVNRPGRPGGRAIDAATSRYADVDRAKVPLLQKLQLGGTNA